MSDWMNWLVMAGIMVALELFSGTFYLLMIALGMSAGALVAYMGLTLELQIIIAALIGAVATMLLRRSRLTRINRGNVARNPDVNLDIGQSIHINEWQKISAEKYNARVKYRGALWDAEYVGKETPRSGMYKIIEIRGSQLIVDRDKS